MTAAFDEIADRVRSRLITSGAPATPAAVAAAVRAERGPLAGDSAVLQLTERLRTELLGAGPLEELLADERVTDILVNGPDEVWVDRGAGLTLTGLRVPDPRLLGQRFAAWCGRRLDDACPYVDARLPDGTRLHAILPPVAPLGPFLSLRTYRHRAFTLDDLVAAGTVPVEVAPLLSALVAARLAYLIAGGTGSGKTTLLSAMLAMVPPTERIVVVEDAGELRPAHPHVVSLEARLSNVEGSGVVTMRDLVRQALRMRPDRLVVGECRGGEVVELLAALNTGHDGGAGTLHANSAADVPARLAALAVAGGLAIDALRVQVSAALRVVLLLRRDAAVRRLDEVCLLRDFGVVPAWTRDAGVGPGAHPLAAMIAERGAPVPPILCVP